MSPTRSDQLKAFALIYGSYVVSLAVKRNFSFALPEFGKTYGISGVGSAGAAWELANGVSKVGGGVLVDLLSPTLVLSWALGIQGLTAALFAAPFMLFVGFDSSALFALSAGIWGVNGFAQAFLWPALSRIFMAWFPDPKERGLWYSILATSQNAGAGMAPLLTAHLAGVYGWPARLFGPAALAASYAFVLRTTLADEPGKPAAGAASAGKSSAAKSPSGSLIARFFSSLLTAFSMMTRVVTSRTLWLLGLNYTLNSFVRNAFTTFFPVLVEGAGGLAPGQVGLAASANLAYELGGAVGNIVSGAVSDRLFGSRRGPVMALFCFALAPLPLLLTRPGVWDVTSVSAVFFAIGLCAFPPHMLNGLVSRELAPQDAVSSAGGFTKSLGQVGAAFADAWVIRLATGKALGAALAAWGVTGGGLGDGTAGSVGVVGGGPAQVGEGMGAGWVAVMWLLSLASVAAGFIMLPLWNAAPAAAGASGAPTGSSTATGKGGAAGSGTSAAGSGAGEAPGAQGASSRKAESSKAKEK